VHTLCNWEQGRRNPEGPAIALLKIAARHPKIVREAAGLKPPSAATEKR
jgi:putative transcriptional regulator